MTEPTPAGALACPFVAFEADRDARADTPDHRHRCYAELRPAPRALAHQEAFCLSPGFAACPTFQDWARREAARPKASAADQNELAGLARPNRSSGAGEASAAAAAAGAAAAAAPPGDAAERPAKRDWAAPPVWTGDPAAPNDVEPPAFLTPPPDRGPSSSAGVGAVAAGAAAGLAGSRWLNDVPAVPNDDPELADLDRSIQADQAARQARDPAPIPAPADDDLLERDAAVAAVATASAGRRASQVSRRQPPPSRESRPPWERSRRNEAYPTLKTRMGMPAIPRLALALGALVIAAVVIFSLPFLLNFGGASTPTTPPASVGPSDNSLASSGPSSSVGPVAPTAQIYIVAAGDNLGKIAKKFGLTVAQLEAANPQIKNPNNIKIGDKITIPTAAGPTNVINGASPSPS
jgi:LysM repeat protein